MSRVKNWRIQSRYLQVAALLALFVGTPGFGYDVSDLSITERRELRFGGLERTNTVRISYKDDNAGEFSVEGSAGRKVRLMVEVVDLINAAKPGSRQLHIELVNAQCAFSRDGGRTWETFSSGPLFQDTQFPAVARRGDPSSILVRVGGTVAASTTQERGDYSGNVRLTASYTDSDEGLRNCAYSSGYWKNHNANWPTGYSPNAAWYGAGTKSWSDMLGVPPRGDAGLILAKQYIAASLNLAQGSDPSTTVMTEGNKMMSIQDIVDACTGHYRGITKLPDSRLLEFSTILDNYNNGRIGPGHCGG